MSVNILGSTPNIPLLLYVLHSPSHVSSCDSSWFLELSCIVCCSNIRLLEESGADLVFFSPLEDDLPSGLAGVYLGGGYPEKYAQRLSNNKPLIASLKAFADAGGVVYAECGGLIYLSQSIQPMQELPVSMGKPGST